MRPLLFALLLPVCLISEAFGAPPAQADADATFTRANADYAAGKFPSAIEGYESLVKSGQWNPSLFYNLGNAYFRTGDLGRAILNYERALALDPSSPRRGPILHWYATRRARSSSKRLGGRASRFSHPRSIHLARDGGILDCGRDFRRTLFLPTPAGGLDLCPPSFRRDRGGRGVSRFISSRPGVRDTISRS